MIDKSTRQHYAMQGKIKNYLGKQKMVKAPKKWKSGPGHPNTELAYITKAEKDLILKADLHSSLSKGPNRGPSGIISLNSAGSGYGGPGPGSSGGGGNGSPAQRAREQRDAQAAARQSAKPPSPHIDPPKPSGISPMQSIAMTGNISLAGETVKDAEKYIAPVRNIHEDTKETLAEQETLNMQQMIAQQQEEKYGPMADPTKFGETVEGPDLRTQKEKDEDLERATDWDKVKKLSKKGYDYKEIQDAVDKGLLTKADPQSMKTNLLQRGIRSIRNIFPETRLEKSLLGGLKKSFAPTTGGMFDPKKIGLNLAKNFAMKKLGLGWLNPYLGIASLLGFDFGSLTSKFAKKPAFDIEAASKLGLQANRFPGQLPTKEQYTDDTLTAKARDRFSTQIAGGKGLESGAELLGLQKGKETMTMYEALEHEEALKKRMAPKKTMTMYEALEHEEALKKRMAPKTLYEALEHEEALKKKQGTSGIEGQQAKNIGPALIQMRDFERKAKAPDIYGTLTPKEERMYKKSLERDKEEKVYKWPVLTAAHGGRIDKPLMGRSRYL